MTDVARRTQRDILDDLESRGAEYRPYWIATMIWARGDAALIERMANRPDVHRVFSYPTSRIKLDVGLVSTTKPSQGGTPWNLSKIQAPLVWGEGVLGDSSVVGCIDTGVDRQHPAIINQYRGWDGSVADHNYNWHDAIRPFPCSALTRIRLEARWTL